MMNTNNSVQSEIIEYACLLAEKELAERHDLKTSELTDDEGNYLPHFQDPFNHLYDKWEVKLIELTGKRSQEIF